MEEQKMNAPTQVISSDPNGPATHPINFTNIQLPHEDNQQHIPLFQENNETFNEYMRKQSEGQAAK